MLEIKLKNTYKKLIHYFSIFTIIFGTTFGSLNSAYAEDLVEGSETENLTEPGDNSVVADGAAVTVSGTTSLTLGGAISIDTITGVAEDTIVPDVLTIAGGKRLTVAGAVAAGVADTITFILSGTGTVMDLEATAAGTYTLGSGTTLELAAGAGNVDFTGVANGTNDGEGTC